VILAFQIMGFRLDCNNFIIPQDLGLVWPSCIFDEVSIIGPFLCVGPILNRRVRRFYKKVYITSIKEERSRVQIIKKVGKLKSLI
jgi:hypothetical protein